MTEKRYYIKVKLNEEEKVINVDYTVEKPSDMDSLDFFHEHVAHTIDITNLNMLEYQHDIAFIVDDEGLLISKNPIYRLIIGDCVHHIAGTFLIGRNMVIDEEMHTVGFTVNELREIHDVYGLNVGIVSFTE